MLELVEQISQLISQPVEHIRIWSLVMRFNCAIRPHKHVDLKDNASKSVVDVARQDTVWNVFAETASDVSFADSFNFLALMHMKRTSSVCDHLDKHFTAFAHTRSLPRVTCDEEAMVFFKFYDPRTHTLRYVFKLFISKAMTLNDVQARVNRMMGFELDTGLLFFEQVCVGELSPIVEFDKPLGMVALFTGDICVFQLYENGPARSVQSN
jgi:hypothetical protein